ncbi:hypothetical protein Gotri_000896 [Gossypium trilobum]|uniref:Uncharacterized protein n=1 Tax=Gossypium trilobum TaxID=34281 RepID=A0A7J9FD86_9ROSI|nr:hypothetical protein [Gossypium trilobum]
MEIEPLMVQNLFSFLNLNVEKYYNELQGNTFIQERAFDPSMILCKEIWLLVGYHRWENFWTIPKSNVVVPFVQEFYASLQDEEFGNAESHMWELVPVRREEVWSRRKRCMKVKGKERVRKMRDVTTRF